MYQRSDDADLALETRNGGPVEIERKKLQRNVAIVREVTGNKNPRHPTGAQFAQDGVAAGEGFVKSWREEQIHDSFASLRFGAQHSLRQ